MSDYQKGLFWTSLGVLCLTPDSLLVRLISCDPWTLLFWRGLLMCLGFSVFLLFRNISPLNLGRKGWLASGFLTCSTVCFVFSLKHTDVANTLVIIATSPLLSAILSWLFLKESIPYRTWVAILCSMGGIALSLKGGFHQGNLLGEFAAFGSAFSMACHFTILRWWKSEHGSLSVWGTGLLVALLSLPFADPLSLPRADIGWTILLGAIILPSAFGMMAVGPRFLPAPTVSLLLLGETVLGPLWVWLVLNEEPNKATLWGGLIVIVTLAIHSLCSRPKKVRTSS